MNQLNSVSARLIQGGVLWPIKGQPGVLDDVRVTASLHEEQVSHRPFGAADRPVRSLPSASQSRPTAETSSKQWTKAARRLAELPRDPQHRADALFRHRRPDPTSRLRPLFVSIDLSEIEFA
jgi:hypothetical protein